MLNWLWWDAVGVCFFLNTVQFNHPVSLGSILILRSSCVQFCSVHYYFLCIQFGINSTETVTNFSV